MDLVDMSLSKLWELVVDREAWRAVVHSVIKSRTRVSELNYTEEMLLLKCHTQYVSKFGKLNSGHRTGKGQFSFQSQNNVRPKNI